MDRRDWLKWCTIIAGGAGALVGSGTIKLGTAQPTAAAPAENLKITDIKTVLTAPAGIRLVVVKVLTNQPGLYGLEGEVSVGDE